MWAVHVCLLGGESPLWGGNRQPLAKSKGVHREVESNLKGAGGKTLARGTETTYKAKVVCLNRTHIKIIYFSFTIS